MSTGHDRGHHYGGAPAAVRRSRNKETTTLPLQSSDAESDSLLSYLLIDIQYKQRYLNVSCQTIIVNKN
jgi:hypothetical protein